MRVLLIPLYRESTKVLASASALVGITDTAVNWGLQRAGRKRNRFDRAFLSAYHDSAPAEKDISRACRFWDDLNVLKDESVIRLCFFGNMAHRLDFKTVIEAARILETEGNRIQVVLCGAGETEGRLKSLAANITNVVIPGWVDKSNIWTLMQRSDYGLLPYPSTFDFALSYPNKVGEYLSAGLPIISSAPGAVEALLRFRNCGYTYSQGNVQELTQLIARCADEKDRHNEQSTNARATFEELFDRDRVYGSYCDFIEEMADIGIYNLAD